MEKNDSVRYYHSWKISMLHPFWIVNSSLLALLFFSHFSIRFLQVPVPQRELIKPKLVKLEEKVVSVNIEKIYKKDLFDTISEEPKKEIVAEPLPTPPIVPKVSAPSMPPKQVEPKFLDPLNVTLKGIFFVGSHRKENSVIIQNNTTNEEITVSVGDKVQDATVIRIFKNKVILLRVNGQQEILYLREEDVKQDASYGYSEDWNDIIIKVSDAEYQINLQEFMVRIANVGELLYALGITTAYKNGKSIGCRVGVTESDSLGSYLGLKTGDIITDINNRPVITTQDRLEILQEIGEKKIDDIAATILRGGRTLSITYHLKNMIIKQMPGSRSINQAVNKEAWLEQREYRKKILSENQNYLKQQERVMLGSKKITAGIS
jgi:type II secretory pathway component PulC